MILSIKGADKARSKFVGVHLQRHVPGGEPNILSGLVLDSGGML